MRKRTAFLVLLVLTLVCFVFVACSNTDGDTNATLKSEIGNMFEQLTVAEGLVIDNERNVIVFTVDNSCDVIDVADFDLSSGEISVKNEDGEGLSALFLSEGENVYTLQAINGALSANYTLKITRKSAQGGEGPHTHTFASAWSKDANYHWHAATCGHDVESNKAAHTWQIEYELPASAENEGVTVYSCTVCGANKIERQQQLAHHDHTYADAWTKDANYHWHASTCGHDVVSEKNPHAWDSGEITTPATDTTEGVKTYTCEVCGATKTENIGTLSHVHTFAEEWTKDESSHWHAATCGHEVEKDKALHSWNSGEITTPATETTDGVKTYTCSVCGATKTESIGSASHIHTYADVWSKDDSYHWHAATCGHDLAAGKAEHNWQVIFILPATETSEGVIVYSCNECKMTKTDTRPQLVHKHIYSEEWTGDETYHWHEAVCGHEVISDKGEHEWDEGEITTEPTQYAEGVKTYTCAICDGTKTESVEKLPHEAHEFGEWTVLAQASCSLGGVKVRVCPCGAQETEVVPPSEHDYKETVTEPTCLTRGYTTYVCSKCSVSYVDDFVDALGHDLVKHSAKAPTCLEKGWRAYDTCSRCDYTTYEELSPTGHNYEFDSFVWDGEKAKAKYLCANDSDHVQYYDAKVTHEEELGECDGNAIAILYASYGGYFGQKKVELSKTGHDLVIVPAVAATYDKPGYTEARYCGRCGKVFKEKELTPVKRDLCDILLNENTLYLKAGDTFTLTATLVPSNALSVPAWTSDNKEVVSVEKGVLTALAQGTATISVMADDCIANCTVYVLNTDNGKGTNEFSVGDMTFTEISSGNEYALVSYTGKAKKVVVPDIYEGRRVREIYASAFAGNTDIETVTLPNSISVLPTYAFDGCVNLKQVTLPSSITAIPNYFFRKCFSLTTVTIPETVTQIGEGAFCLCASLTSIEIPSAVSYIASYAFQGCLSLASVKIPAGVTDLYAGTFRECVSLQSVEWPENLQTIGESAFERCASLESAVFPSTLRSIGKRAFLFAEALNEIEFPSSNLSAIPASAFSGCYSLTSVVLPENIKQIGESAFSGCSYLESLEIRGNLTSLGKNAFYKCLNLTSIYWGSNGITSLEENNYVLYIAGIDAKGITVTVKSGARLPSRIFEPVAEHKNLPYIIRIIREDDDAVVEHTDYLPYLITGITFESKTFAYDGAAHTIELENLPEGAYVYYKQNSRTAIGSQTATAYISIGYAIQQMTATIGVHHTLTTETNMPKAGRYTVLDHEIIPQDDEVTLTATTSRGYTFLGWYEGDDLLCESEVYTFYMPAAHKTYTAKWTYYTLTVEDATGGSYTSNQLQCKVKFDSNGGTSVASQVIDDDTTLTYPAIPTKSGYAFKGWYSDSDCKKLYDFTSEITSDVTLYAGWEEMSSNSYSFRTYIDVVNNYNSTNNAYSISTSGTSSSYANYTYFTALTSGTYYFYYANGNSSSNYSTYVYVYNVTQNTAILSTSTYSTYYNSQSFTANAGDVIYVKTYYYNYYSTNFYYYLTGAAYPEAGGTVPGTIEDMKVTVGTEVSLTALTEKGYTFLGWYDEKDEKVSEDDELTYTFTMPDKNVTYTPKWIKVTITSNDQDAGTITELTDTYVYGEEVTVTAVTKAGYTWLGWYDEKGEKVSTDDELTYTFTMPDKDTTYTAKWTYYTLTVEKTAGGSYSTAYTVSFDSKGGSSVEDQTIAKDTAIAYPSIPTKEGYAFKGWYADSDCTELYDFTSTITENLTLYAGWAEMATAEGHESSYIDVVNRYNNSSDAYAITTTSSDSAPYFYFTALKSGTYYFYYKNGYSYYDYSTYVTVYNVTKGSSVLSNYTYSTSYYSQSFTANAGDVIRVAAYIYSSYPTTFSFYVTGAAYPTAGGTVGDPASFNVTFDSNGGTSVADQTIDRDTGIAYPSIPTKSGYAFKGWYADSDCTELYDFTRVITKDLTLYAGWEEMSSNSYYSRTYIDVTNYGDEDSAYSVSTSGTSSTYAKYTYFTALTKGTYTLYYKNGYDDENYTAYFDLYNVTQGTDILSASTCSTTYESKSFELQAGDVIYVKSYCDYYSSTLYFYVTDASYPEDGGKSNPVTVGDAVTLVAETKAGYTFLGWYDEEGEKVSEDDELTYTFTMEAENVTYTAKWIKVTIAKSEEGAGTVTELTGTYVYGEEVTLTAETTDDRAVWLGWYDEDGEKVSTDDELTYTFTMPDKDTTYTAKWIYYRLTAKATTGGSYTSDMMPCIVTFDSNGGTSVASQAIDDDTTLTYPAIPTKSGYAFRGWYSDSDCTRLYDFTSTITGDLTLYAGWTAMTTSYTSYYIDVANNYNSSASPYSVYTANTVCTYFTALTSGTYYFNYKSYNGYTTVLNLYNVTRGTYIISSYYSTNTSYYSQSFTVNAGDVFYVKTNCYNYGYYTTFYYYITGASYPAAGGGKSATAMSVSEISNEKVQAGKAITLEANTTDQDYTWLGWYDAEGTKVSTDDELTYTFEMPAESVTYTARWARYTLTTETDDADAGSYTIKEGELTPTGEEVTLTAEANEGYTFLGWYDGDTKVSEDDALTYTFEMPAEDKTFTAKWEAAAE